MTTMFAFGTGTHAESAVAVAAQSYKVGLAGIWYQWVMLFTLPLYWLLTPVFRRARVLTTADFFERRFGAEFMLLYAIFALYVTVSMTSVMLYGSARMLEALTDGAISWQGMILLVAVVSFLYGIAGGLIAAVWNDFLQGFMTIVMSLLVIPFFWMRIGGLEGFRAGLSDPQETFRLVLSQEMTLYWIIAMTFNSLISMLAQPHIMANVASAKSEMDSRVGFISGMILKRLMTIPWALTGVMAIALFGAGKIDSDHAFGAMCRELLPSGFLGLMMACAMASVMDNCAVNMLSFAGIYSNSIHRRIMPAADEKTMVNVSRLASLAFAVVSIGLSYAFTDVPAAMRFLWQTIPLMGIPFVIGLLWRRANRYGAFGSFLGALGAMLVGRYAFGWEGDVGLPKTITLFIVTGVLTGIVISLVTKPESKGLTDAFFLLLKTPIGQEHVLLEAGFSAMPGTNTFAPPAGVESRQDLGQYVDRIDQARQRHEAVYGFIALVLVVLGMLAAVVLLARWLAGP